MPRQLAAAHLAVTDEYGGQPWDVPLSPMLRTKLHPRRSLRHSKRVVQCCQLWRRSSRLLALMRTVTPIDPHRARDFRRESRRLDPRDLEFYVVPVDPSLGVSEQRSLQTSVSR